MKGNLNPKGVELKTNPEVRKRLAAGEDALQNLRNQFPGFLTKQKMILTNE